MDDEKSRYDFDDDSVWLPLLQAGVAVCAARSSGDPALMADAILRLAAEVKGLKDDPRTRQLLKQAFLAEREGLLAERRAALEQGVTQIHWQPQQDTRPFND
jgi:hypothetical protein